MIGQLQVNYRSSVTWGCTPVIPEVTNPTIFSLSALYTCLQEPAHRSFVISNFTGHFFSEIQLSVTASIFLWAGIIHFEICKCVGWLVLCFPSFYFFFFAKVYLYLLYVTQYLYFPVMFSFSLSYPFVLCNKVLILFTHKFLFMG